MDYKQKYEQLEKFIKDLYPHMSDYCKEKTEGMIPELKESEDEKIRKELIQYLKDYPNLPNGNYCRNDFFAWLEKQGLQKQRKEWNADDVWNYNQIMDILQEYNRTELMDGLEKQCEMKPQGNSALEVWKDMRLEVYHQASGNRHEPNYSDDSTKMFSLTDIDEIVEKVAEKQGEQKLTLEDAAKAFLEALSDTPYNNTPIVEAQIVTKQLLTFLSDPKSYNPNAINEQKPAEWSEEDEKTFNTVIEKLSEIDWLKLFDDSVKPQPKCVWSKRDEKMWVTISDLLYDGYKLSDKKVSWNKIRCWLLPKIIHLKGGVQPQSKQEWSEEDERIKYNLIKYCGLCRSMSCCDRDRVDEAITWLKSLKQRMKGE